MKYSPNANDKIFTEKIKIQLEQAGIEGMSTYKLEEYIRRLYGHLNPPPERKQFMIEGQRGCGYNHIKLSDVVAFDGLAERRSLKEQRKEEARLTAKRKLELEARDTTGYHQDFLNDKSAEFRDKTPDKYHAWLADKRVRPEETCPF